MKIKIHSYEKMPVFDASKQEIKIRFLVILKRGRNERCQHSINCETAVREALFPINLISGLLYKQFFGEIAAFNQNLQH